MRVVSLGDLVLDVIVRVRADVARGADTPADVSLSAGGQGANVAAWVASLGGTARWLGKRATDAAGRLAAEHLERYGVELAGPVEPSGNGVIVSLADLDGERSMFPDRGVATTLQPRRATGRVARLRPPPRVWLRAPAEPVRRAAVRAVDLARRGGARVSVDLSSWSAIRGCGPERFRALLESLAPDVVFANEAEDEIVGGRLPGSAWILKRGARGCSFDGDERAALPVADVVDTTGAGDALAAGLIVSGPELALEAAARCVQRMGPMP